MGYIKVFRVLQELFPQVDARVLKAVSFEHHNDADVAAEVVLSLTMGDLPERLLTVGASSKGQSSLSFSDGNTFRAVGGKRPQVEATTDHVVVNPCIVEHSSKKHVSSVDGSFLGATGANCDGVPLHSETFGGSTSINANNESTGSGNVDNGTLSAPEDKHLVGTSETNLAAIEESDPISSTKTLEKDDLAVHFANSEDESAMSSTLTRSAQICSTEYLDEVIEDAKSKKKTFELAMNSVIDLMKAVESKENDAEQANEDVTRGCSDILAKVDEIKHALVRAIETNDMHSGEVNAEKAILATEMRELQVRLFTLSDERTKSLEILDEMRRALEIRMAAALEEIAAAEDKKLERERSAREALSYHESQMQKVVEESKKLMLEAEENSKLQEFLTDRGRVIDILQGEMAVKCQDVLLLKEKFDKRIPLSQSFFSRQTSSTLASPNSSFRSTTAPFKHETDTLGTPKKSSEQGDSYGILDKSSMLDGSPKSPHTKTVYFSNGEEKKGDDELKGVFDEDEWELCNNGSGDFLVT